ncbi:hypothetical protein [uncultured Paraglaciecola sp.]|uniref:hypothetical protein n=1 Tax=uncultured Paraglaciecola sp. TaxID=1765024 RepID=UPI0030DD5F15|tara:strand:+ start:1113 stop:1364 length:252 start_codon:yes stop_codon:yes gene_type:complete
MHELKIISLIVVASLFAACSNSVGPNENKLSPQKYSQKRSMQWCQDNYFSASVGAKAHQSNAKHCDTQANRDYLDAKEKQDNN